MTHPADLRPIAHAALSLSEPPYLKHYKRGRYRLWNGVALHTSELPGPGFNFAAVLHPDAPTLDELLPVAREFFADAGHGWGVLVEGDAGHPMEAELRSGGWRVDEDEPAYVLPRIDPPPAGPFTSPPAGEVVAEQREAAGGGWASGWSDQHPPPGSLRSPTSPAGGEVETGPAPPSPLPPGGGGRGGGSLSICLARTEADRLACNAVTGAAFGAPPDFADLFSPPGLFADPGIGHLLGSVDGTDVAAVMFARVGPTAVVAGTATLEPHRGKGYGAALVRAALAEAAARGCTSAALRSGPLSRPLYERLGFRYVCRHRTYAAPTA
jgi:GNAT superfamily N-acetyltransferase